MAALHLQWTICCILYMTSAVAVRARVPVEASSMPAAVDSGSPLKAVLSLDDPCQCAAQHSCSAEGDDAPPHCAFGAMQHSVHARSAATMIMAALDSRRMQHLKKKRIEAPHLDDEDSLIIFAARYFAGRKQPRRLPGDRFNLSIEDSSKPGWALGAQLPHGGRDPIGWKHSQGLWLLQGDTVPSWTDIPTVSVQDLNGRERATFVAPILAITLMVLSMLTLVAIKHILERFDSNELVEMELGEAAKQMIDEEALKLNGSEGLKNKTETREGEANTINALVDSRLPMEPMGKSNEEMQDHDNKNVTRSDQTFSGGEVPPVWFYELFRFATFWDRCAIVISLVLACIHGSLMPVAFYQVDGIFRCIYFPNDDGTLPPIEGAHTRRDEKVWHVARIYLYLACAVGLARSISVILMSQSSRRQTYRCRMKIFETLLRRGPAWHDLHDTSEMTSRVSMDTFFLQHGLAERPLDVCRAIVVTIMGLGMAAHKNWKLTVIMCITVPISAYAGHISNSLMEASAIVTLQVYSKAGAIVETTCRQLRTVFAFNGQQKELDKYQEKLLIARNRGTRIGLMGGFCAGVNGAIGSFALSLGVYFGSIWILESYERECWASDPPFGTCLTGGTIMGTLYTVLWALSMGLGTLQGSMEGIINARCAARRIFSIIDEPAAVESQRGPDHELLYVEGHLSFENVVFSYPSRLEDVALRGITLTIPAGNTVALVGPSGSGKTTIVNLILRFYEPTSGCIRFDGHDTQGLDCMWMRSKMALVEQEPPLFRGTIVENITYGSPVDHPEEKEVHRAAKMANAHGFITKLPLGYETEVGDTGAQLSGGQKQRIAIARSLIRDPTLLILDEATSALDSASEKLVQDALNKLMQGRSRTMLIVAHRLTTVRNADQICVLENGHLVEQGTHCSLLAKKGLYCNLVQGQVDFMMLEDDHRSENQHTSQDALIKDSKESQDMAPEIQKMESVSSENSVSLQPPVLLPAQELLELEVEANAMVGIPQTGKSKKALKPDLEVVDPNWQGRLWEESRPEYSLYFLGVLCISLSAIIVPWYMMRFAQTMNRFNRPPIVRAPGKDGAWVLDIDELEMSTAISSLCIVMQGCGLVIVFVNLGAFYAFHSAAEALTCRLRIKAFHAMLRQEIAWHDQHPPGILSSRLWEQIPQIKMLVGNNLASGCQACMGIIFGLGLAFIFSWRYTLCVLGPVPIIGVGSMLISWTKFENENLFGGMVSEALCSIKTVAAFNLEKKLMVQFKHHLDIQGALEYKASWFYGVGMGLLVSGIFTLLSVDVWFANLFVNRREMSQDRALVVFFCVFAAAMSVSQAFIWIGDRGMAMEAAQKFFMLLDRQPIIDSMRAEGKQPAMEPGKQKGTKIEFEDIHFFYPSRPDVQVFQGFSLTLEPNTTTALVGVSGSGKSTAVALLQRFYEAQSGVIRFNGDDIRDLNLAWLRSQMGLVQQEPVLFAGSVLENIRYGCSGTKDPDVVKAARAANAHGFVCNLPNQYLTDLGSRGAQLSGGQKQRIAIARALVRNPSVFLLDEATASLDTASERLVQAALDELLKTSRHTSLIIAHRLSTIQGADQICVLSNGRLEQKGTHQELLRMGGLYSTLIGRQQRTPAAER